MKGTTSVERAAVRYRFGTAELDPQRFELRVAGQLIEVQRKPLEILSQLLAHAGQIVTREQLLDSVWNGRPVVDNVIASAITKLRGALGRDNAACLITHPRVGYRWCGLVERIAESAVPEPIALLQRGAPIPHRIDFSLVSRLDATTHNEVWSACHNATGDLRVYKFALTEQGLSALKREAALVQLLKQSLGERSEIVPALDWNFRDAPFFLAYPFAGSNLAEWAADNDRLASLSRGERLDLFVQIANCVHAAHSGGVVHQDLKPSNIMISSRGPGDWLVRLTDFGSSRLLQSERLARIRITQFGLLSADTLTSCSSSATPLYIAPELLAGCPATVHSDIYALGVLLFQLLVGDFCRPMTPGWDRQIDDELLREDIARATDCDPAQRFANVAALRERITALAERREALEAARQQNLALHAQREIHLIKRARRGWMVATLVLSSVVVMQGALLLYDWISSK